MASPGPNLFHRLHKWAHRQDENFLTEALAVVLEHLLVLAPDVGTRLVSKLTGGFIDLPREDASAIEIHTQVEALAGRPDLEVRAPGKLAWVEVKAESELRAGQLEGYRLLLNAAGVPHKLLGLLTRYPQSFGADDERPDVLFRWFEVADWFEGEFAAAAHAGDVAHFVVRQFLDFLEARGMTLVQVGKFMPEGLRALTNLLNMLAEAAAVCRVTAKKQATWEYMGLKLAGRYWVGVQFADPEWLVFATHCRVDPAGVAALAAGELWDSGGEVRWRYEVNLDSEEIHFFSRSKVGQMDWLTAFLRDCLGKARSIEIAGQAPTPEPDEES